MAENPNAIATANVAAICFGGVIFYGFYLDGAYIAGAIAAFGVWLFFQFILRVLFGTLQHIFNYMFKENKLLGLLVAFMITAIILQEIGVLK